MKIKFLRAAWVKGCFYKADDIANFDESTCNILIDYRRAEKYEENKKVNEVVKETVSVSTKKKKKING